MGNVKIRFHPVICERCGGTAFVMSTTRDLKEKEGFRCHVCKKRLCGYCYKYCLCLDHYNDLKTENKEKVDNIVQGSKKRSAFASIFLILIGVFFFSDIMLIVRTQGGSYLIGFPLITIIFLCTPFLMCCRFLFSNNPRDKLIKKIVDENYFIDN
ncbi:MAG: hypothetical protein ACFFCS_19610 [Candidatus Hodarchaeota archaeon]